MHLPFPACFSVFSLFSNPGQSQPLSSCSIIIPHLTTLGLGQSHKWQAVLLLSLGVKRGLPLSLAVRRALNNHCSPPFFICNNWLINAMLFERPAETGTRTEAAWGQLMIIGRPKALGERKKCMNE